MRRWDFWLPLVLAGILIGTITLGVARMPGIGWILATIAAFCLGLLVGTLLGETSHCPKGPLPPEVSEEELERLVRLPSEVTQIVKDSPEKKMPGTIFVSKE